MSQVEWSMFIDLVKRTLKLWKVVTEVKLNKCLSNDQPDLKD